MTQRQIQDYLEDILDTVDAIEHLYQELSMRSFDKFRISFCSFKSNGNQ